MDDFPADRWTEIDDLFDAVLQLPPAERLPHLREACGDDDELYQAVRALLSSQDEAARVIGDSVSEFAADLLPSLESAFGDAADSGVAPGSRIGPYRVVRELGRGGMGAVYLAERADGEFEKRVAIKLVKRGMDSDEIKRRFLFERRILASLEHPNVARLYDGGVSEDGRAYLVMELVEGEPITEYCDAKRFGIAERLQLFGAVCEAVQHAHQRLVIHRDVKPSNILVTADGTPKLLDFGIAKLLGDEDVDMPRTRTGIRILTPEYAAPEQIRGDPVTTASDVHALGAVLYELLTGHRAFPRRPTGEDPAAAAARLPVRPSVVVGREPEPPTGNGESHDAARTPETVAAARGTTQERLRRQLQGDLDTIVLKALDADPRVRYPSVQQLLEDLGRYRAGLPVLARPPALGYRAAKFARRHRMALASAAVVILSLVGGLGAALWQADLAAAARDRAEEQRLIAEDERDAAEEVAGFLEGMFAASNPFSAEPGRMDTMRIGTFLERGADRIDDEFADRPLIRARMLGVVGRVYRSLGLYDRADPMLREALELLRAAHGDQHLDLAEGLNALGNLHLARGRPAEAEQLHREALEIRRALLGPDHADVAASLSNLAAALQDTGRFDEAEPLYDELLAMHRRLDPPDSAAYADALNSRMTLAYRRDEVDTALPLAREILEINRALLGDEHPRVAMSMNNLAQILSRTGANEEAESLMRQALAMNRSILGGDHPDIAAGADNLASLLLRLGRDDEAQPLYRESIDMKRRLLGDDHPSLAITLNNYADLLASRSAYAEAEGLYREALSINRASLGPEDISVGIVSTRLAGMLCDQGRLEVGRGMYEEALAILRARLPEEHSRVVAARDGAAACADTPESLNPTGG